MLRYGLCEAHSPAKTKQIPAASAAQTQMLIIVLFDESHVTKQLAYCLVGADATLQFQDHEIAPLIQTNQIAPADSDPHPKLPTRLTSSPRLPRNGRVPSDSIATWAEVR